MSTGLDAKANVRAAIRRLIVALRGHDATVTIERRDLELVMTLAAAKLYVQGVQLPNMHPEQR